MCSTLRLQGQVFSNLLRKGLSLLAAHGREFLGPRPHRLRVPGVHAEHLGASSRGHDPEGPIYRLHARAIEAPAHRGIDAQHLTTAVLDDLVGALPAAVAEGKPSGSVRPGRVKDQAQHFPVGGPEGPEQPLGLLADPYHSATRRTKSLLALPTISSCTLQRKSASSSS